MKSSFSELCRLPKGHLVMLATAAGVSLTLSACGDIEGSVRPTPPPPGL